MLRLFLSSLIVLCAWPAWAQNSAVTMTYQGTLQDAGGQAITGTRAVTFRLYAARAGGEAVWTEAHPEVDVVDGQFTAVLGSIQALAPELAGQARLYLGVQVGEDVELTPRMAVGGALKAQWAAVAARRRPLAAE